MATCEGFQKLSWSRHLAAGRGLNQGDLFMTAISCFRHERCDMLVRPPQSKAPSGKLANVNLEFGFEVCGCSITDSNSAP